MPLFRRPRWRRKMSKVVEKFIERGEYPVYKLGGVTYVPHFQNDSVFVGPGHDKSGIAYRASYLIGLGAKEERAMLWKRGTSSVIKNVL